MSVETHEIADVKHLISNALATNIEEWCEKMLDIRWDEGAVPSRPVMDSLNREYEDFGRRLAAEGFDVVLGEKWWDPRE